MNKNYSGPAFLSLVLLYGFLAPLQIVSNASAEPVQPAASSARDIEDALDAMDAGVPADDALGERPIPFRHWGKVQKQIFETLFDRDYTPIDAIYTLDSEVTEADEFTEIAGHLPSGDAFTIKPAILAAIDNNDPEWPDEESHAAISVNANILVFAGTITTNLGTLDIQGSIWQGGIDDNDRDREVLITDLADSTFISTLEAWHFFESQENDDIVNPTTCQQAFKKADINYHAAIKIAKTQAANCMIKATIRFATAMSGCAGGAIVLMAAPPVSLLGFLATAACALGALADQANNYAGCVGDFATAQSAAQTARTAARNAARAVFGDDCPDDPR